MENLAQRVTVSRERFVNDAATLSMPFDRAFNTHGNGSNLGTYGELMLLDDPIMVARYRGSYWSNEASRLVELRRYVDVSDNVVARVISYSWGNGSGMEQWSLLALAQGVFGNHSPGQVSDENIMSHIRGLRRGEPQDHYQLADNLDEISDGEIHPISPILFTQFL